MMYGHIHKHDKMCTFCCTEDRVVKEYMLGRGSNTINDGEKMVVKLDNILSYLPKGVQHMGL